MTLETVKKLELYKLLLKTSAISYTYCVYFVDHQILSLFGFFALECSLRIILIGKQTVKTNAGLTPLPDI